MTSGNIAISSTPTYATYSDWNNKYKIPKEDESKEQFETDMIEALKKVRRECFYWVREAIVWMDSNKKIFLPQKWLTDGNFSGDITVSDLYLYEADSDNRTISEVDSSNISSIDGFNNVITMDSSYSNTRQLYISYFAAKKPLDEIVDTELKLAIMAKITILVLERLEKERQLKGISSWSAAGMTLTKNEDQYDKMYKKAMLEYDSLKNFLKPFVCRRIRTNTGFGNRGYDTGVAYSNQVFPHGNNRRIGW